ncbi:MAG: hypothetical protein JSR09_01865 [Bacteroidetes bacterium]|nr:hypothetical protein [Bacteroidota bacterium]MBS1648428.1 hypothetical protein [Bacteroidota bacterium]
MNIKKIKFGPSIWKLPVKLFFLYYFLFSYISGYTNKMALLNALSLSAVLLFFHFIGENFFGNKERFYYWRKKNTNQEV